MPAFSRDVLGRNPELRDALTRRQLRAVHEDMADRLLAEMQRHAPELAVHFERDRRFLSFKIDLASDQHMLAIEVNGGLRRAGGGKHATARDHQKVRELVLAGWRVLIFTASEVRNDPLGCIADIRRGVESAPQEGAMECTRT